MPRFLSIPNPGRTAATDAQATPPGASAPRFLNAVNPATRFSPVSLPSATDGGASGLSPLSLIRLASGGGNTLLRALQPTSNSLNQLLGGTLGAVGSGAGIAQSILGPGSEAARTLGGLSGGAGLLSSAIRLFPETAASMFPATTAGYGSTGNIVAGGALPQALSIAGPALGIGSGILSSLEGQPASGIPNIFGGATALMMLTNPVTAPFAWIPGVLGGAGGLLGGLLGGGHRSAAEKAAAEQAEAAAFASSVQGAPLQAILNASTLYDLWQAKGGMPSGGGSYGVGLSGINDVENPEEWLREAIAHPEKLYGSTVIGVQQAYKSPIEQNLANAFRTALQRLVARPETEEELKQLGASWNYQQALQRLDVVMGNPGLKITGAAADRLNRQLGAAAVQRALDRTLVASRYGYESPDAYEAARGLHQWPGLSPTLKGYPELSVTAGPQGQYQGLTSRQPIYDYTDYNPETGTTMMGGSLPTIGYQAVPVPETYQKPIYDYTGYDPETGMRQGGGYGPLIVGYEPAPVLPANVQSLLDTLRL